jgi:Ca-activated chloride channel homolog
VRALAVALPDWLPPRGLSFSSPFWLILLLLVPLTLIVSLLLERRRASSADGVAFTNIDVLASVIEKRQSVKRWVPLAVLLLALAVAAAAVAKPKARVSISQENATVIMLVDVSGSMQANDVKPTRMAAAVTAMDGFVSSLPSKFKIGLVEFSSDPAVVTPPTTDRDLLANGIDFLTPNGGTAIGEGLATAVRLATSSLKRVGIDYQAGGRPLPAVIVFLSDGAQNRGTLTPLQGAERAKKVGIRVYTVSLGTPTGVITYPFGLQTYRIHVPPDPQTMTMVSKLTGGQAYTAYTASKATEIYKQLGSSIGHRTEKRQITSWFAIFAGLLLVLAVGLARLWGSLLP